MAAAPIQRHTRLRHLVVKAPLPELAVVTDPRVIDAILEHTLAGARETMKLV